jgi:hypothetical protein
MTGGDPQSGVSRFPHANYRGRRRRRGTTGIIID